VLLGADVFPAGSWATIVYAYVAPGLTAVSVYVVFVLGTVANGLPFLVMS
jgi:hypothetical protein